MVIRSTNALDVIIQAVSPELSGSGGGAAARAEPVVTANAPRPAPAPIPNRFSFARRMSKLPFMDPNAFAFVSQRIAVDLPGADAHDLLERRDEDFSVADLSGLGFRGDRLDRRFRHFAFDGDLDLELRQEAHGVFGAAVDFGMSLLSPVALDLGDGHALHAQRRKLLADLVEFEGFDDRRDELHLQSFHG